MGLDFENLYGSNIFGHTAHGLLAAGMLAFDSSKGAAHVQ
jgi:hypothetical protein